jgi:hypothetical protein
MFEYELQLLRNNNVLENRNVAIQLLNSYKYHAVGQPISLLYTDPNTNTVKTLFAVGKKNGEGSNCGSDYYDIINVENQVKIYADSLHWNKLI